MKLLLASAVAGLAIAVGGTSQDKGVQPGEQVDYTFRDSFIGTPGPGSIADLAGKPVLIDFWGTR